MVERSLGRWRRASSLAGMFWIALVAGCDSEVRRDGESDGAGGAAVDGDGDGSSGSGDAVTDPGVASYGVACSYLVGSGTLTSWQADVPEADY